MPQCILHHVRFAGMASCVPKGRVSNLTDCPLPMRAERERLVRNIGIEYRRVAQPWQCFSDLAFDATQSLLDDLGWAREEVDALIVVTQSPDYLIPATAIILQDRLGLAHSTLAFDVNLGCSAYPFALHLLGSMIASGSVRKGLVLVGDKASGPHDPLFSDAGTATALEFDASAPPMYFDLNSDGSGYQAIIKPVGGYREPISHEHLLARLDDPLAPWRRAVDLVLDGPAVLSFSTRRIPPAVEALLSYANVSKDEVDYFVFHQANRLINETLRKKLGLPEAKVPGTLRDYGNTSGASLPVTMTARIREQLLAGPNRVLLCGFGIGLSWGTCLVDINQACFPPMIES